MARSTNRSLFNEATRVQMPALVHLTRIGYSYFGKITEDMAGTIYDPDTNILINVFKEQFAKLNPDRAGDAETMLRTIRQELDNDDIGESFYKRLKAVSPVRRAFLTVTVGDSAAVTVQMPASLSAKVIYLGSKSASIAANSTAPAELDQNGVCWGR